MPPASRSLKPFDWRQMAALGEQLLSAHNLQIQKDRILTVTRQMIRGDVDVWLNEDLFRLPDWTAERLFPSYPSLEGMRRAIKSGRTQVRDRNRGSSPSGIYISLPFEDQGIILGAIQVTRPNGPKFQQGEMELLEGMAHIVSMGLFAAHRVEVERFRRGQLNLVREVSTQIASLLNVNELAQRVTALIQKTFNYYYVAIFTLKQNSTSLRFRSSAGTPRKRKRRAPIALEVDMGQGLIGEAAASGEQIVCDDVRRDPRFRYQVSLPETRSEVVIPLIVESNIVGVLDVQSNRLRAFHPNDLLILNALADNVARAIEGARLYGDLRRRADQLSIVAEVSKSVTSTLDLRQLMNETAALIHERFGYDHVSLFTVHPNRHLISYEAGSGRRTGKMQGLTLSLDEPRGIIPLVARRGETLLANDVSKNEHYDSSRLPPLNTHSELTIPLIFHERVLGILDIQSERLNAFNEDDQVMFEAVADTIAAAIRNADLYQSEIWRRQVADSLREVAGLLSGHAGVHQVLEAILVELERNLPVDMAAIWMVQDGHLDLAAAHGVESDVLEQAYQSSPESRIVLKQGLYSTSPMIRKAEENVVPSGLVDGFGNNYSAMMVPMRLRDQPVGLITLIHRTPGKYGHEAQAMTTTFANYAAVAIENARLYDTAQEQAYASAALLQVAQTVVSSKDLDETLATIIRTMPILIGVHRAILYLWDPLRGQFNATQYFGLTDQERKILAGSDYTAGRFPLLDRVGEDLQLVAYGLSPKATPRSWMKIKTSEKEDNYLDSTRRLLIAIPLTIKNDLYGVMLLEEAEPDRRFRSRRIEIINGVAQQTALAIQNDRLQREMVVRERLETEVQLARQIQQTFIPASLPEYPGWQLAARWQTARQVGGDFFDVIELPDRKLGLFIADVADKGVPAALFMALTRTLVRAAILEFDSPAQALRRVNDLLLPDTRQGMFVTAVYGVLDLSRSEFTYVNAGHNPPLFLRTSGELERLTRTGIALGLMEQPNIAQQTVQFKQGEILLLYTDGVTEAFSEAGDFFGESRLTQMLQSTAQLAADLLLAGIETGLKEFTGDQPAADDITMLAVKKL